MNSDNIGELVVLVDSEDHPLGSMEKMDAHQKGEMHRAVSILVFNSKGEWLLHRRALEKYHAGGLWTNACCTHPFIGESYKDAACRRMQEEMGLEICPESLVHLFDFTYKAVLDKGLTEHEYDRVFACVTDVEPSPNKDEVMDWKYLPHEVLDAELCTTPHLYTPWFRIIYQKSLEHLDKIKASFGKV
ncbi:MAG: isopentenyl-diphosphate Delta-isomerase [Porphyromonas sp.]|nr:isopentenyl-diphosphate Delta-isomerase [Porphyromonas sp.]